METIITNHKLKDLDISLSDLYKAKKQLIIHLSNSAYTFTVSLKDREGITDCKISSFVGNMGLRTNRGTESREYKTLGTLESALKRLIRTNVNNNGVISFSLTDEISYL